jgi:ABC-2 type transport system permease protein
VEAFASPDDYFAFVVVGLFVMQTLTVTLVFLPQLIRQELVAGTFERTLISPFGAIRSIVSMTLFPIFDAFVIGCAMIVLAVAIFDMPLSWDTAPLALPLVFAGALTLLPFALIIGASVVAFKQGAIGVGFIVTAISLVGGFLFPVELLPDWLEWMSDVQPFTPLVELQRHVLLDRPIEGSAWVAVAKIVGFTLVLLPIGLLALRAGIRHGQRRGTITEY